MAHCTASPSHVNDVLHEPPNESVPSPHVVPVQLPVPEPEPVPPDVPVPLPPVPEDALGPVDVFVVTAPLGLVVVVVVVVVPSPLSVVDLTTVLPAVVDVDPSGFVVVVSLDVTDVVDGVPHATQTVVPFTVPAHAVAPVQAAAAGGFAVAAAAPPEPGPQVLPAE